MVICSGGCQSCRLTVCFWPVMACSDVKLEGLVKCWGVPRRLPVKALRRPTSLVLVVMRIWLWRWSQCGWWWRWYGADGGDVGVGVGGGGGRGDFRFDSGPSIDRGFSGPVPNPPKQVKGVFGFRMADFAMRYCSHRRSWQLCFCLCSFRVLGCACYFHG